MSLTVSVEEIVAASTSALLEKHETWERVPLSAVANVVNGAAFKSSLFSRDEGMPLIRIRDVGSTTTECRYLGNWEEIHEVHVGDIIVGMDGDFRVARWQGETALLNQRVCRIDITTERYARAFLELALPGYLNAINELTSSTTVKHLSSRDILKIPLPLPPLAEQKRIVAKVEALLARVNKARERLDRVPGILKQFRQSVLAAACSGRLTAVWRDSQPSTSVSWHQSVRGQLLSDATREGWSPDAGTIDDITEFPECWAVARIGTIINSLEQGWSPKCENRPSMSHEEWGVIKTTAVQPLYFNEDENKALPASLSPHESLELRVGDVLITRAGPRVRAAVTCYVKSVRPRLIVCDKVYRFRTNENFVIPEYVALALNTRDMLLALDDLKTGISDSGVNLTQKKFTSLLLAIPTVAEQYEIVKRVEYLFSIIDGLEQRWVAGDRRTKQISQAVLAKAFAGELVETEADLARREGRDYEPASVLLERISGERAAENHGMPTRKSKNRKK